MRCHRVIILDKGEILETGEPHKLLRGQSSELYKIIIQNQSADYLASVLLQADLGVRDRAVEERLSRRSSVASGVEIDPTGNSFNVLRGRQLTSMELEISISQSCNENEST